jgi:2-keto-4-pentenoate hydratase/2-oxohepta-3-ene-1,7-dioic acid hydratase in catechol pathway
MKLVTFRKKSGEERAGWIKDDGVVDMHLVSKGLLPADMLGFIDDHEKYFDLIKEKGYGDLPATDLLDHIRLLAPLPNPRSFRDYIGFETHMLNASKSFGHSIGKEWYEMPIFYFTNHHGIFGPDDEIQRPAGETRMDIELELAIIIGKRGKDIKAADADSYIFGYTVFNDWTARAIQAREMKIPLGPHKGKDFANAIGPCIVTRDEMQQYAGENGKFNLEMKAWINGKTICEGNYNTVYYGFPQMIERASENNVTLMPGDILGSGTVGWGSLVENNFEVHRPLEPGDVVELEIEGIGILKNKVV